MPTGDASLVRRLLRLAAAPADGDLLDRSVRARDEAAFGEPLRGPAPLVPGVCRRVLRGPGLPRRSRETGPQPGRLAARLFHSCPLSPQSINYARQADRRGDCGRPGEGGQNNGR